MRQTICLGLILLFVSTLTVSAQDINIVLNNYGVEDGLLHRNVQAIFEDTDGFIWIGTEKGLQRYDGHDFKNWTKYNTNGVITNIENITQDDAGWLWLWNKGQEEFIFLNPLTFEILTKSERFGDTMPPIGSKDLNIKGVSFNPYLPIIRDRNRKLFLSTYKMDCIISYDTKNGFKKIPVVDAEILEIKLIDSDKNIWLSKNLNEVIQIDSTGKIISSYPLAKNTWVEGIYQWEGKKYVINSYYSDVADKNYVLTLISDGKSKEIPNFNMNGATFINGKIWNFSEHKWAVYDIDNYSLLASFDKTNLEGFRPSVNISNFRDSNGIFWLYDELGLSQLYLQNKLFNTKFAFGINEKKPFNNSARGILLHNNTLFANFELAHTAKNLNHANETQSYSSSFIWPRPIISLKSGDLLVGYDSWVANLSPDLTLLESYKTGYTNGYDLGNDYGIWSLHQAPNGKVWVGKGNLLCYLDKEDKEIKVHDQSVPVFNDSNTKGPIQNMITGKGHNLWLCSKSGLYLFDTKKEAVLAKYGSNQEGDHYLPADVFYYIHIDKEGTYWIGTSSGLIKWSGPQDPSSYRLFGRQEGLVNEVIYAVFEDDYNRLWVSSDYGIMSMDKENYDIQAYNTSHGLSHNEFNRISQYQAEDGTIYFGGLNGITYFHPKDFDVAAKKFSKILVTDYEIFDGKAKKVRNLTSDLVTTKRIDFYPSDKYFRVKFSLPNYDNKKQVFYAWKIPDIQEDWIYQKENSIQINTLSYGNHKLKIKAQSGTGGWSPKVLEIDIIVHKPFYLQYWFLATMLLLTLVSIWQYNTYRVNKFNRDKEKLEKAIVLATSQIQKDKSIIEKQAEELSKLDQLKSRFFANVSHELRTPLSLMLGPIKNLQKLGEYDSKETKLLDFLYRNTLHLKNLVNEILDLSKLENNKLELNETSVEFYSYLKKHLNQFYSVGSSESIKFMDNLPTDRSLFVLLDTNKFEKIINNYLSNALKFTPPGGIVKIIAKERQDFIHITVKDSGRGIHPQDMEYVFDRFYQSKDTNGLSEGGTGIGLSLCKELVELMGGKVWVESTLGEGSDFHLTIEKKLTQKLENNPVQLEYPAKHIPIKKAIVPINQNKVIEKQNLLIVEDNDDLRSYFQIILSDYNITACENGKVAIDHLNQCKELPDLIISDLMMPVMDGMKLINTIKSSEQWRHLPVIMLTAKSNRDVKLKALRIGIDDYITKPFDDEELLVRINNLLSHYQERNEVKPKNQTRPKGKETNTISQEDMMWLEAFEKFVVKNLNSSYFSISWIAQEFSMSESTLQRQLKKLTGLSPAKYINEHKLNHARSLLESQRYNTISQVAQHAGFANLSSFSRSFKQRYGLTPTEV